MGGGALAAESTFPLFYFFPSGGKNPARQIIHQLVRRADKKILLNRKIVVTGPPDTKHDGLRTGKVTKPLNLFITR